MKARRTGRPSVNVPSEKMEAFLTEVKSVKLKKINGNMAPPRAPESSATALARELGGTEKGREVLRSLARRKSLSELDAQAGDKRKRKNADGEETSRKFPLNPTTPDIGLSILQSSHISASLSRIL